MKKVIVAMFCLLIGSSVFGADRILYLPIKDVLNSKEAKEVLDPNIKFEFGNGSSAKIIKKDLISNKKTNRVGKKDEEACAWVLLSALKSFQDTAKQNGASKVVNLKGYFKKDSYNSKTNFQCAIGLLMAGVTLKGDIAK